MTTGIATPHRRRGRRRRAVMCIACDRQLGVVYFRRTHSGGVFYMGRVQTGWHKRLTDALRELQCLKPCCGDEQ